MMRISTKGRYALRIMLDLAAHADGSPVSLRDVAERQKITLKYMESIMAVLLHAQLVTSLRGKSGGYKLARPADAFTLYDILNVAEGDLMPVHCLSLPENDCELRDHCITLPVWAGLSEVIRDYLQGITLADLLKQAGKDMFFCNNL